MKSEDKRKILSKKNNTLDNDIECVNQLLEEEITIFDPNVI